MRVGQACFDIFPALLPVTNLISCESYMPWMAAVEWYISSVRWSTDFVSACVYVYVHDRCVQQCYGDRVLLYVCVCVCVFVSLTHSLTHPPTHPLTHPPTHSLTHSLTHPLTHSLTHPLTHPPTHSLTHSPTHPLTHPPTHSPTHSHVQVFLCALHQCPPHSLRDSGPQVNQGGTEPGHSRYET